MTLAWLALDAVTSFAIGFFGFRLGYRTGRRHERERVEAWGRTQQRTPR